jgi:hypothetical protein
MTRRFQFSLKTMLVAMLVVAAFFGGVHVGTRSEHRRFENQIRADGIARLREAKLRWNRIHGIKVSVPTSSAPLPSSGPSEKRIK